MIEDNKSVDFKFLEDVYTREVFNYILSTYKKHYAKGDADDSLQTFELIAKDKVRGLHFAVGSILKYADRMELKDQTRSDILKIIHYGYLSLYCYDKMTAMKKVNDNEAN